MKKWLAGIGVLALGFAAVVFYNNASPSRRPDYVPMVNLAVSPGPLSAAHAFLKNDCQSCHTPGKSVEVANCVTCHANNTALLQRQPTAFHANISNCAPCHLEHQNTQRPTQMNHVALAQIGLRELKATESGSEGQQTRTELVQWMSRHSAFEMRMKSHPRVSTEEAALNCVSCHATLGKAKHQDLLGTECASCHATTQWTIPEFQHPSPNSINCAQCHGPPPSHRMMHFKMISASVAKQPNAQVNQCYSCHQTTAWNDIKGVGWYKHH